MNAGCPWQAAAAEPESGVEELPPDPVIHPDRIGEHRDIGPGASQSSAIALMNEIFVARNEFAAVLTSSAVA